MLVTPRLTLAPHRADDLDHVARLFGDRAVMGPIGAPVATREASWQRLLRYIGHWQALGFGHWLVRETATGAVLGEVGLMDSRRDSAPSFEGVVEAGWAFLPEAHSRGYAAEACGAMLAWADGHGIARTVCMIAPDNAPSLRLAAKLGYGAGTEGRYAGKPIMLLERRARSG